VGAPRKLGDARWTQVHGTDPMLLVPVGSTEQHGPHLPLDTDTRIAVAVAAAAAAAIDGALLAPAICYGASGEHRGFAGTVSIGTAALAAVLTEYGRSACDWARRLVFVNAHGGNLDALRTAGGLLRVEGRDVGWIGCAVDGADPHAGHTETALMLHLSPGDVDTAKIGPGSTAALADLMPALRRDGVAAVSPSGVLGDPRAATPAEGARILAAMVHDCLRRVRGWDPDGSGMLRR
jgi:mycofactocin precursor peptide peptidase